MSCGNEELINIHPSKLQNNYWICSAHFDEKCIDQKNRTRINEESVPVYFNCEKLTAGNMELYDVKWNINNEFATVIDTLKNLCGQSSLLNMSAKEMVGIKVNVFKS